MCRLTFHDAHEAVEFGVVHDDIQSSVVENGGVGIHVVNGGLHSYFDDFTNERLECENGADVHNLGSGRDICGLSL